MTEDLSLPIRIITAETVREDDGLAMSSRNQHLTDEERVLAPLLYETLSVAVRRAQNLATPDRDCDELVVIAAVHLGEARLIDNIVVTI